MKYLSAYNHVNQIEIEDAWEILAQLVSKKKTGDPHDMDSWTDAVVSLARRAAELECDAEQDEEEEEE